MKMKKVPMRKCIGCNVSKPKRELYRIVRDKEGNMHFDPTGRKNGRGAYTCPNLDCVDTIRKARKLEKEFKVHIDNEVYDRLVEEIKEYIEKHGGGAIGQ
jgi:predicted RNA-binding protein YlxR (DUF448 family)